MFTEVSEEERGREGREGRVGVAKSRHFGVRSYKFESLLFHSLAA